MGDIKYLALIGLFCGFGLQIMIMILSFIIVIINKLYDLVVHNSKHEIAWGFHLSIASVIFLIITPQIPDLINSFNSMIMF